MEASAGTFYVAKVCMLLSRHRRFIECYVNPGRVAESMLQRILLYVRQILSKQSDIDGEEEFCRFSDVYVKEAEATELQKRLNVWGFQKTLFPCKHFRHTFYAT